MTEAEFLTFKETVLNNCPRGEEYFCDGTPNLSVDDGIRRKNIGTCQYRINGKCSYIANLVKEQVVDNDCKRVAGERV